MIMTTSYHFFTSDHFLSSNDTNQHDNDRKNEQNVNKPAHSVRRHQSEEPKNKEHDRDSPQHTEKVTAQDSA